jgi:dTDP-4-dehydrorhamnose reductase
LNTKKSSILIFGGSGMLGHNLVQLLSESSLYDIYATFRNNFQYFNLFNSVNPILGFDAKDDNELKKILYELKPDIVINCIGIIKQLPISSDPLEVIPINSLFPHKLAYHTNLLSSRLIHISTDCVFNGLKGNYTEDDLPDALDLYGKSKELGEIIDKKHVLTIRTSMIGHEIYKKYSLLDWFLNQEGSVYGYENAMFSGLPTIEVAEIVKNYILPNDNLHGLYHLSANSISKKNLLEIIAEIYNKDIKIITNSEVKINRTLIGDKFNKATGYSPDDWEKLVIKMKRNYDRFDSKLRN